MLKIFILFFQMLSYLTITCAYIKHLFLSYFSTTYVSYENNTMKIEFYHNGKWNELYVPHINSNQRKFYYFENSKTFIRHPDNVPFLISEEDINRNIFVFSSLISEPTRLSSINVPKNSSEIENDYPSDVAYYSGSDKDN